MGVFLNSILENDELLTTDIKDINDGDTALDNDINDGIESPVEDPLEEASMIMYESQANFNQIMMAIGMHELNEAANGRVAVFTEADVSGFFAKVKETIKRMYTRIVTAINEFLVEFGAKVNNDKTFFANYKAEIAEGFEGEWSIKGYDYSNFDLSKDLRDTMIIKANNPDEKDIDKLILNLEHLYSEFDDHVGNAGYSSGDIKNMKKDFLFKIADKKDDKIKTVSDAIKMHIENIRGKEPIELNNNNKKITLDQIKKSLDGTEYAEAKNTIVTIRNSYKSALDRLSKIEKAAKKNNDIAKNDKNHGMKVISALTDVLIFERNCVNSIYLAGLRMLRDKNNQARKIAHMCYNIGKKKDINIETRKSHVESGLFSIELI